MFPFTSHTDRSRATSTAPHSTAAVRDRARRPGWFRALGAVASTAVLATALVSPMSPAAAGPAGAPAAEEAIAADPCGFYRYWIRSSWFAVYNHCGSTTIRIHADVSGGGSGNDFHLCVGPGKTALGAGGNFLNAYYIGGAGCPKGQQGPHTAH